MACRYAVPHEVMEPGQGVKCIAPFAKARPCKIFIACNHKKVDFVSQTGAIAFSNHLIFQILMTCPFSRVWGPIRASLPSLGVSGAFFAAACFIGVFFTGCVTKAPPSQVDKLDVKIPAQYTVENNPAPFHNGGWMEDFSDPQLEGIILEALQYNYDLKLAEGRLEAARATSVIQGSGKYPSINISHTGNRAQRTQTQGFVISSRLSESFSLNNRISWEFDIWGTVRDQANAGLADYQAAFEIYRAARFSIAARTARAWYGSIAAQLQLNVALQSLETFESNLEIIEENFKRGLARALDLRLMRANVASSRSAYEQRLRTRDGAIRTLEILLGRYPADEIEVAQEFPTIKSSIPVGLPDELLMRRPDLIAAERRLAADATLVKAARKARLPGIFLTASGGTSSRELGDVLNDDFKVWSLNYNIGLPVFQGGRLFASEKRIIAIYEQSLANFAQIALIAYSEVESALIDQGSLRRDEEAQKLAVIEYTAAEELAWEQYNRGLVDIITVLESQRRLFNAQRALIQVANQRIQSRIDLYLALGGGFAQDIELDIE